MTAAGRVDAHRAGRRVHRSVHRTFFHYFPTKESVLFFGENDFARSFVGAYLAQPVTLSELAAMEAAFVMPTPRVARLRERIGLHHAAVARAIAEFANLTRLVCPS